MLWRSLGAVVRRGLAPTASSARPFSSRSYGQEQNGDDPENPHRMRSLRCGGNGPFKTRAESGDHLLFIRQHSTFDQTARRGCGSMRRKAWLVSPPDSIIFLIGAHPRVDHGTQSGISRFHPAKLYLFKQLGERVRLRDGRDRTLQSLFA